MGSSKEGRGSAQAENMPRWCHDGTTSPTKLDSEGLGQGVGGHLRLSLLIHEMGISTAVGQGVASWVSK